MCFTICEDILNIIKIFYQKESFTFMDLLTFSPLFTFFLVKAEIKEVSPPLPYNNITCLRFHLPLECCGTTSSSSLASLKAWKEPALPEEQ